MNELLEEINQTIKLLESNIPANPLSNEKLEAGLLKSLKNYCGLIENALDINEIERIYYRNVKQE